MYKYGEDIERRIKEDRERLKRYGDAVQILRAAARVELPGEVVKEAGEVVKAVDEYIASLTGAERIVFDKHYRSGASLGVVADMLGRSRSGCIDIIRRQLAAVPLSGDSSQATDSRQRRRTWRVKREQPQRSRRFKLRKIQ